MYSRLLFEPLSLRLLQSDHYICGLFVFGCARFLGLVFGLAALGRCLAAGLAAALALGWFRRVAALDRSNLLGRNGSLAASRGDRPSTECWTRLGIGTHESFPFISGP